MKIPATAQHRAEMIHNAAALVRLAQSAQESILLGDHAQANGNLASLNSLAHDLRFDCSKLTLAEHRNA